MQAYSTLLCEGNMPNSAEELITVNSILSTQQKGIAVLLLDAENLQINTETEKFLTTVCTYPIQIKIAFANWCNRGKLDVDLHERNYDLIHVPVGKDNADGKMIAFGSAIHERFPNAKEVLVCSSDKVMTNLCNHLQQNGLTVYRVSKQGDNVTVLNSKSGQKITYSPKATPTIPSLNQFINILKKLIKAEQKCSSNQWVDLAVISQKFHIKYKLTISQVVSTHLPGKKASDIFIDYPHCFAVHQIPDKSELYVTLFEIPQSSNTHTNNSNNPGSSKNQLLSSINSTVDLEQALIAIWKNLNSLSKEKYVTQEILGTEFCKQYGEGITKTLKSLQFSGSFIKFLESSSSFELNKTKKNYRVVFVDKL